MYLEAVSCVDARYQTIPNFELIAPFYTETRVFLPDIRIWPGEQGLVCFDDGPEVSSIRSLSC